ncbi:MAG: hypothetical protein ACK4VY_08615 [Brevundimonas sp.]
MDIPPRFFQARLKLQWAQEHIRRANHEWKTYLKTDFCKIVIEDDPEGGQQLRVVSLDLLPADIVLAVGDAVHNLRCALDYTVSELLGWKDTRLTFPMAEDRAELTDSFRTVPELVAGRTKKKGRNAALEQAIPGIGQFIIDEIAPYKAAKGYVWILGKLDARDKHRLLIPVLVPQTISAFGLFDHNGNGVLQATGTVGPGGAVNLVSFGSGFARIGSYGEPTAEIFFNEPGIIEGRRVIPVLVSMSKAVAETIDQLDDFVTSVGWVPPGSRR